MHFCPWTITTQAESINSDLQRGLDRRLRHTTLNTEQNQLTIKACEKIAVFFNFVQNLKHTYFYAKFIVDSISENRFNVSCL